MNSVKFIKRSVMPAFLLLMLFSATAYAAFSSATRITNNTLYDSDAYLAIENNNLHLLIRQTSTAMAESGNLIYRMKSSTGWNTPVKIATDAHVGIEGMGGGLSIASYSGKAHAVYAINDGDDELVYKTNKSGSWPASPVRITTNKDVQDFSPVLANQAGKFYLVFVRQSGMGDSEILFSQNLNGTWSTPIALTNNTIEDTAPFITAKGGKVYITWAAIGEYSTIKYRVLSNGSWSTAKTIISSKAKMYFNPQIAVYNDIPYVSYSEYAFNMDTMTSLSNVGFSYLNGSSWSHQSVTNNATESIGDSIPIIANNGGKIRLVWFRYGESSPPDIIFGSLDLGTKKWTSTNITNTPSISDSAAAIVVDSNGKSHIVYASGNQKPEIYYRKEQ